MLPITVHFRAVHSHLFPFDDLSLSQFIYPVVNLGLVLVASYCCFTCSILCWLVVWCFPLWLATVARNELCAQKGDQRSLPNLGLCLVHVAKQALEMTVSLDFFSGVAFNCWMTKPSSSHSQHLSLFVRETSLRDHVLCIRRRHSRRKRSLQCCDSALGIVRIVYAHLIPSTHSMTQTTQAET